MYIKILKGCIIFEHKFCKILLKGIAKYLTTKISTSLQQNSFKKYANYSKTVFKIQILSFWASNFEKIARVHVSTVNFASLCLAVLEH